MYARVWLSGHLPSQTFCFSSFQAWSPVFESPWSQKLTKMLWMTQGSWHAEFVWFTNSRFNVKLVQSYPVKTISIWLGLQITRYKLKTVRIQLIKLLCVTKILSKTRKNTSNEIWCMDFILFFLRLRLNCFWTQLQYRSPIYCTLLKLMSFILFILIFFHKLFSTLSNLAVKCNNKYHHILLTSAMQIYPL